MPSSHDSSRRGKPATRHRIPPPPLSTLAKLAEGASDAPLTPGQQQLLYDCEALRLMADEIMRATNRINPRMKGPSTLKTYVSYVHEALWCAEHFLRQQVTEGGEIILQRSEWPRGANESPTLVLRPPPAKVIDLAEARARRRAGGGR
jgi:hypothetical protein